MSDLKMARKSRCEVICKEQLGNVWDCGHVPKTISEAGVMDPLQQGIPAPNQHCSSAKHR